MGIWGSTMRREDKDVVRVRGSGTRSGDASSMIRRKRCTVKLLIAIQCKIINCYSMQHANCAL